MSYRYTAEHIEYKGHLIQTYVIGNGKHAIFAFPPFPHSGVLFSKLTEVSPGDYTIYTIDQPGWSGYSDNIFIDTPLNMHAYIDIAEAVINHYGLKDFSVLGYSFGGALAVRLAAKRLRQIRSIVLVSPILFRSISKADKRHSWLKLGILLGKDHTFWVLSELVFRRLRKHAELSLGNLILKEYADRYRHRHPMTLLKSVFALFNSDATKYLLKIDGKVPLMIVNSRSEGKLFRLQAEKLRRLMKGERTYKISGNHDTFALDLTRESAEPIVKFLTS
jgi:pimeloyl-ACP methyl ester carboxylesterase